MANVYRTFQSSIEQDIAEKLDIVLQHLVGWYRVYTHADTASDKHYVYASEGETNNGRAVRLIGTEAVGNSFNMDSLVEGQYDFTTGGYGSYYVGSSSTAALWSPAVADSSRCRVVANKERFVVFVDDSVTLRYSGYCGNIDSIYSAADDPSPGFVRGQTASYLDWTSGANNRALRNDNVVADHGLLFHTIMTNEGAPNPRDGSISCYHLLLYYTNAVTNYEVRGRIHGAYYVNPDRVAHSSFILIDGDYYFVAKTTDESDAVAFGPVTDDSTVPTDIAQLGFPLYPYLKTDYTARGLEYESTTSGTLALWRFDTGHLDGYIYGSGSTLPTPTQYPDTAGVYNLTPQNSLTSVESRLREAADFNGTTQYASAAGDVTASGVLNGEWTFEMVFKPDTIPTGANEVVLCSYGANGETEPDNTLLEVVITAAVGTTPDEYNVERGNVKVSWEYSAGMDVTNETTGDFVQQNRWNYLVVVKRLNGGTYDLEIWHCSFGDYLTPAQKFTVSGLTGSSGGGSSSWFLGVDPSLTNYYDGQIDDTRITERALTADEIDASCRRAMV